ncbi:FecCD family ABC transporter permease [Ancylobacter oerskovii]|uniref:FecCD family ABC transporter permease n=1 Tax=Ancylobacter oerskovii TaxID=459519 RepID=A0ABW4YTM9_9HYPH|nr:iron chelate uptake ABC transporter family permease subunit [Ancylobacter oerskovii]MBS7543235.1 iron chelate uptake ABC transporter family permease subunit [Ancylobacter oerskovii]
MTGRPTAMPARMLTLRLPAGRLSLRVAPRAALCCAGLGGGCLLLALAALTIGTMPITLAEAARALRGNAGADLHLVVVEWRAPRIAGALLVGAALGMAGALFQTLLRNPLGSPDVVGFDAGSFSGALMAMLAGGGPVAVAGSGFAGGLLAGALVFGLSGSAGGSRARLILTGIAVGAFFTALNDWIVMSARLDTALAAASWRLGSLAGITADRLALAAVLLAALLPLGLSCGRTMRALELGDDRAASLGIGLAAARLRLALVGLGLTAVATLVAGPIGFVALIAPQAARRLAGGASLPLLASALFGAFFLLGSDVAGRLAFAPLQLPAGALTAGIGGLYFVALLWSRRSGGRVA